MTDPDYSPAYQDEYQRLWHEAAARAEAAEAERDTARAAHAISADLFVAAEAEVARLNHENGKLEEEARALAEVAAAGNEREKTLEAENGLLRDTLAGILYDLNNGDDPGRGQLDAARDKLAPSATGGDA